MVVTIVKKQPEIQPVLLYPFGGGSFSKEGTSKELLGGKGYNLGVMDDLGYPVPPGVIIPCEHSVKWLSISKDWGKAKVFMASLWKSVEAHLEALHEHFGYMPLVSVRSGARVSMPGMMDTILNVGMCNDTYDAWAERLGERAALDSYRRLVQMYGEVVGGIPAQSFEDVLHEVKGKYKVKEDFQLEEDHLVEVLEGYDKVYPAFPQSPAAQIQGAIKAVFNSWNNKRAIGYRKIYDIPDDWGTGVVIQSMVFGNMGSTSCTGVVFSRCPSTGTNEITGEFLPNAQGEDVVAGVRTPLPISEMSNWDKVMGMKLFSLVNKLETDFKDMQDVEFTVQEGELYILQTRSGKRSTEAAAKIALDMYKKEGLITKEEAKRKVAISDIAKMISVAPEKEYKISNPVLIGIPAGGGWVTGVVVLNEKQIPTDGTPYILVKKETTPDDVSAMWGAKGILTKTGGLTSHAAVVARGMNKVCVVGATKLDVRGEWVEFEDNPEFTCHAGKYISMNGSTGEVWFHKIPLEVTGFPLSVRQYLNLFFEEGTYQRITPSYNTVASDLHSQMANSITEGVVVDVGLGGIFMGKWMPVICEVAALKPVIVDFTWRGDKPGLMDVDYFSMFGAVSAHHSREEYLAHVVECLDCVPFFKYTKMDLTFIGAPPFKGDHLVKMVNDAHDLESILSGKVTGVNLANLEKSLGGNAAFEWVMKMLKEQNLLPSMKQISSKHWFDLGD